MEKQIDYSQFQSRKDEKEARQIFGSLCRKAGIQKSTMDIIVAKYLDKMYDEGKLSIDILNKTMQIKG